MTKLNGQIADLPATMSDDLVSGLLKNELGFDGVVCTDAMNMAGVANFWNEDKALSVVGCDENRSMEREMAAAVVTVIQNRDNVLPKRIKADSKVLVMVPYDNESGQFIMAWNRAKDAGLIPEGAEIETVRFNSEYNNKPEDLQSKIDKADTIIINSELYSGDRKSNNWRYAAVKSFVKHAEDNGKTSVVMCCGIQRQQEAGNK